jgi:SAM-dependent methyltransferase
MDSTERFSDRVENYARFRPHYPEALIRFLAELLPPPAVVADIGSGTGILSAQLLRSGYTVLAVEPNAPMRQEAERQLAENPAFHSVAGTAEATTLAAGAAQAVTCAQSFHWFDRGRCRLEFQRILREPSVVLLIWNERISEGPMEEYDRILQESIPDYCGVSRRNVTISDISQFFAPALCEVVNFSNNQRLDREAFLGRVLSSSYVPNIGKPGHETLMEKFRKFFEDHAKDGRIECRYETRVYVARLKLGNDK